MLAFRTPPALRASGRADAAAARPQILRRAAAQRGSACRAAPDGRSAAADRDGASASGHSIVAAISQDHQRLWHYQELLQGSGMTHDQREQIRHQIVHDLTVHALAEEEVLYPAMIKHNISKGSRDHMLHEHGAIKVILKDIDQMRADAPGFDARVEDLYRALRHHVEDEDEELDKFASEVDPSELHQLGDKFTSVKGYLPTRPHLNAPDKPSDGLVVADRLTAPIDRLRDAAEQRRV